jgi:hypothetical protein
VGSTHDSPCVIADFLLFSGVAPDALLAAARGHVRIDSPEQLELLLGVQLKGLKGSGLPLAISA